MFAGALVGGLVAPHTSRTLPLLIAGVILAGTVSAVSTQVHSTRPWARPA